MFRVSLPTVATVAVVATTAMTVERTAVAPARASASASATRVVSGHRSDRLDRTDWIMVKNAARLRRLALARHRSVFYRTFAADLGLSSLTPLHAIRPGRCAIAVSYLYDNLLDLSDAYAGENWQPLRRLVRKQPSLNVCKPRPIQLVD